MSVCVCVCVCACACVCTCVCALCVCVRSQCALSRASARRRSLSPSHSSACVDPSSPSSPGNDTWWSPWEQPAQEEKTWPLVNNRAVHQHGVAASVITRSERHWPAAGWAVRWSGLDSSAPLWAAAPPAGEPAPETTEQLLGGKLCFFLRR